MAVSVSVKVGDLDVVTSGVVVFSKSAPAIFVVGAITLRFEIIDFSEAPFKVEVIGEGSPITLNVRCSGAMPLLPQSYLSFGPAFIGWANGRAMHFSYGFCRLFSDKEFSELRYAVYEGERPNS